MKIDAHQHFWHYSAEEYGWIGEHMAALKRDFLPDDLAREQAPLGFDGSIAVQARQTPEETAWLLELADAHPRIRGVVGWVDLRSPKLPAQLERFAPHPRLCGVRHVLEDEPDDRFVLREDFLRGIGQLARWALAYDILLYPRQLPAAREMVARFPEQRFILDHIAKPFIARRELERWASDIRRLAAFPNVACKLSGMVTEAVWDAWEPADFAPYLDVVADAFGPERLMIGSDWPVCTVAGGYAEVMGIVLGYIARLSPDEQRRITGENARQWYDLE